MFTTCLFLNTGLPGEKVLTVQMDSCCATVIFLSLLQTTLCGLFQKWKNVLLCSTEATYRNVHDAGGLSALLSGGAGVSRD